MAANLLSERNAAGLDRDPHPRAPRLPARSRSRRSRRSRARARRGDARGRRRRRLARRCARSPSSAGARYEPHGARCGLNVARNTGVERSHGELVVFVDDDVARRAGLARGAARRRPRAHPDVDVFTGPHPRAAGGRRRRARCGRESAPITTLDLGDRGHRREFAWGANMAIRRERAGARRAVRRLARATAATSRSGRNGCAARARARACATWRAPRSRTAASAPTRACARSAARRLRARAGRAALRRPPRARARRCARSCARSPAASGTCCAGAARPGLTMVAHSAGRLRRGRCANAARDAGRGRARLRRRTPTSSRARAARSAASTRVRRRAADRAVDACELASGRARAPGARRAASAARAQRARARRRAPRARAALAAAIRARARALAPPGRAAHVRRPAAGASSRTSTCCWREHPPRRHDWLLVVDDDVELPRGFLDRFLFLCERFSLALAQPAHRLDSHAAWPVTRRRAGSVVRETASSRSAR